MATKRKLVDLAIAAVKKSDGDKAVDQVKKDVRKAENSWRNEVFEAEQAVDTASERVESLATSVNASGADCLAASRDLKVAKANLEGLQALFTERF